MLRENHLDNTIRAPIGATRAEKVLNHLKAWKANFSSTPKARASSHQTKLDKGDPTTCAEVYKNLRVLEQDDGLNTIDRKQLQLCTQYLSEELANALNQTESETLDQMRLATQI